jgi:hypothetical protein
MIISYIDQQLLSRQMKEFAFTQGLIQQELHGIFGSETLRDFKEILALYSIYDRGAEFDLDSQSGDYVPANHHFKIIKGLIDKEARFLFSHPPVITLEDTADPQRDSDGKVVNRLEANQLLLEKVRVAAS